MGSDEAVRIEHRSGEVGKRAATFISFHSGTLKIALDTEPKPFIPLPIEANLTATDESIGVRIQALWHQVKEGCGIWKRIEIRIGIAPAVTEVCTDRKSTRLNSSHVS